MNRLRRARGKRIVMELDPKNSLKWVMSSQSAKNRFLSCTFSVYFNRNFAKRNIFKNGQGILEIWTTVFFGPSSKTIFPFPWVSESILNIFWKSGVLLEFKTLFLKQIEMLNMFSYFLIYSSHHFYFPLLLHYYFWALNHSDSASPFSSSDCFELPDMHQPNSK